MSPRNDVIRADCERVAQNSATLAGLKSHSILVTGGTGFLGTWIAEILTFLNDQYGFGLRIHILARQPGELAKHAPHLSNRSDINFIKADVANVIELPGDISHVIHAAASPDGRYHASNPLSLIRTVVDGTTALLGAVSQLPKIQRFLNVSSGLVYGTAPPDAAPFSETSFLGSDSSTVTNAYAESKRMAETICAVYRSQSRIPTITVRPFSFLGPYQALDRPWAINNFLRDALSSDTIHIHGDGGTVRSYLYGADAAWWILNVLVSGTVGSCYNIGSPEALTLNELACKIANAAPNQPRIVTGLLGPSGAGPSFVPNVAHTQKELKVSIAFNLERGIERTMLWHRLR